MLFDVEAMVGARRGRVNSPSVLFPGPTGSPPAADSASGGAEVVGDGLGLLGGDGGSEVVHSELADALQAAEGGEELPGGAGAGDALQLGGEVATSTLAARSGKAG